MKYGSSATGAPPHRSWSSWPILRNWLLTYLVAFEAKSAIWIVSEPRPEHVSAITGLNESSSASFYLLKIEAIKIGDSPPEPLLTLVVGPSEEGRDISTTKKELAEQDDTLGRFWTALQEKARNRATLHAVVSPGRGNWLSMSAGVRGLFFNYIERKNGAKVELYIDQGGEQRSVRQAYCEA